MSLRRFVYLVVNDTKRRDFPLRCIDTSRFFFAKGERDGGSILPVAPPLEDARLPPPALRFVPRQTDDRNGGMEFMLHGNGGKMGHRVVAIDPMGRCVMCDPAQRTIRALPALTVPKFMPASLAVGDDLYVIDTHFNHIYDRDDIFDGLLYDEDIGDWESYSLYPPPYARSYDPRSERIAAHMTSYAADGRGDTIWVSKEGLGTHAFDVDTQVWSKAGDWVLPFWGSGKYIPELKLWLGFSCDEDDGVVCASDLAAAPPAAPRIVWRGTPTPPEWEGKSSFLVHLGSSRFCIARFFRIMHPGVSPCTKFVVFTGFDVERCSGGEELRAVPHKVREIPPHQHIYPLGTLSLFLTVLNCLATINIRIM
ncbi:hypothetical protein ACP70R_035894 [Stipagrostis hirtigluma subsp. patula]